MKKWRFTFPLISGRNRIIVPISVACTHSQRLSETKFHTPSVNSGVKLRILISSPKDIITKPVTPTTRKVNITPLLHKAPNPNEERKPQTTIIPTISIVISVPGKSSELAKRSKRAIQRKVAKKYTIAYTKENIFKGIVFITLRFLVFLFSYSLYNRYDGIETITLTITKISGLSSVSVCAIVTSVAEIYIKTVLRRERKSKEKNCGALTLILDKTTSPLLQFIYIKYPFPQPLCIHSDKAIP
jgi:hypothetical protein